MICVWDSLNLLDFKWGCCCCCCCLSVTLQSTRAWLNNWVAQCSCTESAIFFPLRTWQINSGSQGHQRQKVAGPSCPIFTPQPSEPGPQQTSREKFWRKRKVRPGSWEAGVQYPEKEKLAKARALLYDTLTPFMPQNGQLKIKFRAERLQNGSA